jgi:DNA-binding transcriptional MerR regulator
MAKKTGSDSMQEWKPATHDVKELLPQLREPRYSMRILKQLDPKLTYRRLHSWERSGLLSPQRKTKEIGWRKFSFVEAVQLLIISDLKQVALPIPIIRHVLMQLTSPPPGVSWLETCVASSLRGGWYTFFVDRTGSVNTPLNLEGLVDAVRSDKDRGPLVLCPVHEYVRRVLSLTQAEVKFVNSIEPRRLNAQEKKLLSIIANRDYEKIEITKSDGRLRKVRAFSWKKGKFSVDDVILSLQKGDFREVAATTKDGEIITIKATDQYKL